MRWQGESAEIRQIPDWVAKVGLGTEPLRDVLDDFFLAGGKVLLCPLCYAARQDGHYVLIEDPMYFDEPQILIKSPIPLLLEADKVIDY